MTGPTLARLPPPADLAAAIAEAVKAFGHAVGGLTLIGGAALQVYGITRATKDVDFAVTRAGAAEIERLAREQQRAVSPLRIGGICVAMGAIHADFIDRRFEVEALFLEAISAARAGGFSVAAGDVSLPVVPIEYLVALKMVGVRPQDEADVAQLLTHRSLDYAACRAIVARHLGGVAARYLDKAARQAGRHDAPADYRDEA